MLQAIVGRTSGDRRFHYLKSIGYRIGCRVVIARFEEMPFEAHRLAYSVAPRTTTLPFQIRLREFTPSLKTLETLCFTGFTKTGDPSLCPNCTHFWPLAGIAIPAKIAFSTTLAKTSANLIMGTRVVTWPVYRQTISDVRLIEVAEHVRHWLWPETANTKEDQ